jgi:hypothetical protein
MADVTIKQHDTYPPLDAVLEDQDGPIDLTTATTVKLILKPTSGSSITGTCTVVTPAAGLVSYTWIVGDTAVVTSYQGEFEITWATGKVTTVPNDGYFQVVVMADLG